ncbi:hypothetical protein M8J76_009626 [Diaphorina citri]|nr:hypothetical protein M8J75_006503 [Diaphorina citri]KAI5726852.1 hypothetical protein M8J76_009626 [Diaphorina citri]KAI5732002.1 hypothetical protein M8J77_019608 [Diaphorina citri]
MTTKIKKEKRKPRRIGKQPDSKNKTKSSLYDKIKEIQHQNESNKKLKENLPIQINEFDDEPCDAIFLNDDFQHNQFDDVLFILHDDEVRVMDLTTNREIEENSVPPEIRRDGAPDLETPEIRRDGVPDSDPPEIRGETLEIRRDTPEIRRDGAPDLETPEIRRDGVPDSDPPEKFKRKTIKRELKQIKEGEKTEEGRKSQTMPQLWASHQKRDIIRKFRRMLSLSQVVSHFMLTQIL